jgi:tripartite-type tricarboxylate transporter receptor subunit TctC
MYSGDVHLLFHTEAEARQDTSAGKVKILALTADKRLPSFPNTPTFAELDYAALVGVWWALNVREGTPRPIMERLNRAAIEAVRTQEVREFFAKNGVYPLELSLDAASKRHFDIATVYKEIAAKAGIKPQ